MPDQSEQEAKDLAAITAMRNAYQATYATGDIKTVMQFFTDDCLLVGGTGKVVNGLEEIRAYYTASMGSFETTIEDNLEELEVNGDFGFSRGTYGLTLKSREDGSVMKRGGHFLVLFKREPSSLHGWIIYREVIQPFQNKD